MIRHHPSEANADRAAGHLPQRTRGCWRCTPALSGLPRELRQDEAVGGALLAELPPGALRPVRWRVPWRGWMSPPEAAAQPPEAVTLAGLATGRWWWLGPGIRLMPLRGATRPARGWT